MARFTALWGSSAARISQLRAIIRARAVPLSQWVRRLALALLCLALLRFDVPPYGDRAASLDRLIGAHQFDLLRWWVRAALAKARAEALAAHWHMSEEDQIALVQEYVQQLGTLDAVNAQIKALYSRSAHLRSPRRECHTARAPRRTACLAQRASVARRVHPAGSGGKRLARGGIRCWRADAAARALPLHRAARGNGDLTPRSHRAH